MSKIIEREIDDLWDLLDEVDDEITLNWPIPTYEIFFQSDPDRDEVQKVNNCIINFTERKIILIAK